MVLFLSGHSCVQVTRDLPNCCNSIHSLLVPHLLLFGWRLSWDVFHLFFSYAAGTGLVVGIPIDPRSLIVLSTRLPLKLPVSGPQGLELEMKGKRGEGSFLWSASFTESCGTEHLKSHTTLSQQSQGEKDLAWCVVL